MNTICSIFQKFPTVGEVLLFGSRAMGNYKRGSDIDLAIMNADFNYSQFLSIVDALEESDLPYFTDVLWFPRLKNELLKEQIRLHGKIIYTSNASL